MASPSASTEPAASATCTVYRVYSAPLGRPGRKLLFTTYHPKSARVFLLGSKGDAGVRRWHKEASLEAAATELVLEQPARHHAVLLGAPCACSQCEEKKP